jgi:hypothetical protein
VRFLDGFGNRRMFCRSCHESMIVEVIELSQRKLNEFADYYKGRGWFSEFSESQLGGELPR